MWFMKTMDSASPEPKTPKALLLQHTKVEKLNMVATRRLSQTFGFAPMTWALCEGHQTFMDNRLASGIWCLAHSGWHSFDIAEDTLLQDAGFKFQKRPSMSPWRLFILSNLLRHLSLITLAWPGLANPDIYPTTRNSKSIRQNANTLTAEHCNKWKSAHNIKGTVFSVTVLPFLGLGAIILLQSRVESNQKVYRITISHFTECTCPDFQNMAIVLIGKQGQYVNCKHLYYIFHYFCKMNREDDKFIHSSCFSFSEVK